MLSNDPPPVVVIDDDDMFRNTIGTNLQDEGFAVRAFASGPEALDYFSQDGPASVVLLDWRMPEMDGSEVLIQMRRAGIRIPVIVLTSLTEQFYEEVALERGAIDFIDKSRSFGIISRRIRLVTDGAAARATGTDELATSGVTRVGPLQLRPDSHTALWRGREVELTLSEYSVVELLALKAGEDVSYRQIHDAGHGEGLFGGHGDDSRRASVRSMIKRIRKKFRLLDLQFAQIENYPGFGYRWHEQLAQPAPTGAFG